MQELIKSEYEKVDIPAHFEVYNVSNEKIEGLKDLKLLQLPKLHLMKFTKGKINKKELEEQYFRALDSRGQNLIGIDYGSCSIMVCSCETYKHKDSCPIPYLKKYMKIKNFEIEKYV
jgi:hypothetical protein